MKNQAFGLAVMVAAAVVVASPVRGQERSPSGRAAVAEMTMPMGKLQEIVREVAERVSPAVVGLRMSNGSSGSGVMVGEDGLIMTAAHVTHPPGNGIQIEVQFPDGRRAKVDKRGAFYAQDAAFAQIADTGKKWPAVEYAERNPRVGDWVIALGHTAGFDLERSPPVRVGQVLAVPQGEGPGYIVTDCSMAGGDSGGALFDLEGKLIGIHSSIGKDLDQNLHVPIEIYRTHWARMVGGEEWGRGGSGAVLGVRVAPKGEDKKPGAVVDQIFPNSPAEKAGLEPGDRILKFAGKEVADGDGLVKLLQGVSPGDKVEVEVERAVETEVNPSAEVDPEVEPEMETVKLEVEFPGKKKTSERGAAAEEKCADGVAVPIQFDFGNLRRPGPRPGSGVEVGLFTRPAGNGLGVSDVVNGSPADKAGIRRGDLIVKVDGVPLSSPDELSARFKAGKPGDVITVSVRRGGKDVGLEIRLPGAPERPGGEETKRMEKDPNAIREMLAKLREGKVDPEEVRKMFAGRIPNLNMAPGYKPVSPRGEGATLDQFKPVASSVRGSVVEMISGYKSVGLGTAVAKGMVLAKASELGESESLRVEMPSGVWAEAKVVKTIKPYDLALVKVDSGEELVPVQFRTGDDLACVGTMVTAFDNGLDSLGYGVVGVATRSLAPKTRGFLGVQVKETEDGAGVTVEKVIEDSAAEKGGFKVGDLIRTAKGEEVKDPGGFTALIGSCKPGEEVLVEILRDGADKTLVAKLGKREEGEVTAPPVSNTSRMGTKLSEHRYGYPDALQHDIPLSPNQMGGPLVSFDGNVIGLNIARAGRTKTFAIPSRALVALLEGEDLSD